MYCSRASGWTRKGWVDAEKFLLPVDALFTCALIGWRLPRSFGGTELAEETATVRRLVLLLLRYVCPVAIASVLVAAFA
jgi:SNF family Na+-dependent transporter